MGWNELSGSIPTELGNLTKLVALDFEGTKLTGSIPGLIWPTDQPAVTFSGHQRIVRHYSELRLGNLVELRTLYIFNNQVTGDIPPELGNLTNLQVLYLGGSPLTGTLPNELGNLASLQALGLWGTQITGSIPSSLGNLSNLTYLGLNNNQLAGDIPPTLGNLPNLQELILGWNHLTGAIPPELGKLTGLQRLTLAGNRLTEAIPAELGNLTNLTSLGLQDNDLRGPIPASLMNLISLGDLDLGDNALYSDSPKLARFLRSKDKDWAKTQTVPPTDLFAAPTGTMSIRLKWSPIAYTRDPGGYRIFVSQSPSGPFVFFRQTADKTVSLMNVKGLLPGKRYHFVVRTRTDPHGDQQNMIDSDSSEVVSARTGGRK